MMNFSASLQQLTQRTGALVLAGVTSLLAGCASTYQMDNTVQSYSTLAAAPAPPLTYRFERLPSQLDDPAQPRLEALAQEALTRAGLQRDDAQAAFSVQVWSRTHSALSPWAGPRVSGWGSLGIGSHPGASLGLGFPLGPMNTPWYQREVGLVMREWPGGRVVYETHAFNDGYWVRPDTAIAAMLEAALRGFPQPPPGVRRVDIPVPR